MPVSTTRDLNSIEELGAGSGNIIRVTSEAPSLFLGESDKTQLDQTIDQGTLDFTLNSEGYYTVTGLGTVTANSFEILPKHNGVWITEIGTGAFLNKTGLKKIILPSSIKKIGADAFKGSGITEIEFKDSDKIVIFFKNPGWANPHVYFTYTNDEGYEVSNSWPGDSMDLFDATQNIYSFAVPLSIHDINFSTGDDKATTGNYSVADVATDLSNCMFIPKLSGTSDTGVKEYDVTMDWYYNPGRDFNKYEGLIIFSSAFANCTGLTKLNIPRRTTWIAVTAFSGCNSLSEVKFETPSRLITIGDGAFKNCKKLGLLTIPMGVVEIGSEAFMDCADEKVSDPENGSYVWKSGLQSVSLPNTLKSIGMSAFSGCQRLGTANFLFNSVDVPVPVRLESINARAFSDCGALLVFIIPDSTTYLGPELFAGCADFLQVCFLDAYTWFESKLDIKYSNQISLIDPTLTYSYTGDSLRGSRAGALLKENEFGWYKLKKMLPPTLSLSVTSDAKNLTITDKLGVAEVFKIYVNDNKNPAVVINKDEF